MDFQKLKTFVADAQEGGFSAAASSLSVSKSLCSKHINDLEEVLGCGLFH
ncbi:MAG: LysR family transcriptional regulator [Alphaproteobacteria bacterium]|nr:LysR family transcriptional regulator [Alphaproteobacteria bacterium]